MNENIWSTCSRLRELEGQSPAVFRESDPSLLIQLIFTKDDMPAAEDKTRQPCPRSAHSLMAKKCKQLLHYVFYKKPLVICEVSPKASWRWRCEALEMGGRKGRSSRKGAFRVEKAA